jgi:phosphomannomutase/phosphoglucomutase
MEVFGSSGVRGIVGERITPEFAVRIAAATAAGLDADRVALAHDTRTSGPMLADAASAGLRGAGTDVDRLGVVPTPGAGTYAAAEDVPALVVTASHNPPEYNGVKLLARDGGGLPVADLERVEAAIGTTEGAAWDALGDERQVSDARERYLGHLRACADRETVADADLTVALDPGHGSACGVTADLLRSIGCAVRTVNAQPDGRFPGRRSEPVPENLGDLCRLVRATDADLGVAHDGDADRAVFVDEAGAPVEPAASLAALADAALESGDTLVTAVTASQRLVDLCERRGADLELTPVGATYITSRVRELREGGVRVPIAGEGNGGVFFPEVALARDGAYAAVRMLEVLADRGEALSALVAEFDGYANARENLTHETPAQREAMLAAAADRAAAADGETTTLDGYRVDFGDAWVLARGSGTEPIVRVYAEARERGRAEDLVATWAAALRTARSAA